MRIKKRGFHRKRGNFFRSRLILSSLKSNVAFFVIVFLFGVVISIWILDVVEDYREDLRDSRKYEKRDENVKTTK